MHGARLSGRSRDVPRCYLLAVASASSLDQSSNNVSLFNLVEQVNLPATSPPPPGTAIPVEVHAYFEIATAELGQSFDLRFALRGSSGLETYTDSFPHRSTTVRYRTRVVGLPLPPVLDQYELRLDWRLSGSDGWTREPLAWPLLITELRPATGLTH